MNRSIINHLFLLPFFLFACEANVDLGDREGMGGNNNGVGGASENQLPIGGPTCGDGIVADNEQCDDGNSSNGDGCSTDCRITTTQPTGSGGTTSGDLPIGRATCGDGVLAENEQCDDQNNKNGDGCSADCKHIDSGWTCSPGIPCVSLCGDGIVAGSEQCDLGELNGTHQGCATDCRLDSSCGNLILDMGEACDDGNTVSGDGCIGNCSGIEPGWVCNVGQPCLSVCGDGVVAGGEECDLGRQNGTSNCDLDCTILILP